VWDNGPGPSQPEYELVFTPFYRRRGSTTGNGLGLSLVRQIARRHGGDAGCAITEEGRNGFIITLAA
jgi:signal transduction histidine kinase